MHNEKHLLVCRTEISQRYKRTLKVWEKFSENFYFETLPEKKVEKDEEKFESSWSVFGCMAELTGIICFYRGGKYYVFLWVPFYR